MQKSLEHKSLFPLAYETKELPEGKSAQPVSFPMQEIPSSVYVEGAKTPDFPGYWFGVKIPGQDSWRETIYLLNESKSRCRGAKSTHALAGIQ